MNDFGCPDCGAVTERLVDSAAKVIECPICRGEATLMQAMPTVKLEGITGSFPGAADRWARIREENARVKAKRS